MKIVLRERFLGACRGRTAGEQASIFEMLLNLNKTLATAQEHRGVGLRKLHPSGIWEVRLGLSLRALFVLGRDEATFVFLGTHDEVRRFLRGI